MISETVLYMLYSPEAPITIHEKDSIARRRVTIADTLMWNLAIKDGMGDDEMKVLRIMRGETFHDRKT